MGRKALTESPLSLHDQGIRCSNFLPPATSSFPLSQLLTKGFFWRLRVWASRAWVNAATHASLKPPLALNSQSHCIVRQSSLQPPPYCHFLTQTAPAFCGLDSRRTQILSIRTRLCIVLFLMGFCRLKSVLLQQISAEMYNLEAPPVKFEHNTYRPYCLSVCKVKFSRVSNVTMSLVGLLAQFKCDSQTSDVQL